MALICWNITLIECELLEKTCPACCAEEGGECQPFSITSAVAGVAQVGNVLSVGVGCSETAADGIYHDCPTCPTNFGCITVAGGSGVISAITACTGANSCGSGEGSVCENSSTINTNVRVNWGGRNKISVSALDTWETLYESPNRFSYDFENDKYYEEPRMIYYIKQIYINNCYSSETNDKYFSVRLYNADTGYNSLDGTNLVTTVEPAELVMANHLKLENGENKAIITYESPIRCFSNTDTIQIQSHTSLDGFNISVWLEEFAQGYDERDATKDQRRMTRYAESGEVTSINTIPMKVGRGLTGTPIK